MLNKVTIYSNVFEEKSSIRDESDIYGIWMMQTGNNFESSQGMVKVISTGIHNRYSGPDFKNAIIQFENGQTKYGDIEIHESMNDWYNHKHSQNPKYSNVILHVINEGIIQNIVVFDTIIPTISLNKKYYPSFEYCQAKNSPQAILEWIQLEAYERWEKDVIAFSSQQSNESKLYRVFKLLDITGANNHLISSLSKLLLGKYNSGIKNDLIVEQIVNECSRYDWCMGKKRPFSHPNYRIAILTQVALFILGELHYNIHSLKGLEILINKLKISGYFVPGKYFMHEIMGNIVLPYSQNKISTTLFYEWFNLPTQIYGFVKRRIKNWELTPPITFGLQQGVIKIDRELCQKKQCDMCPIQFKNDELLVCK
jgi:hypothetical protein